MGKSDPFVFNFYLDSIKGNLKKEYNSVAFFGQEKDNIFTKTINAKNRHFFDLSLENWDINKFPFACEEKFDLIICTRVGYFSKNPKKLLIEFKKHLVDGGKILIDWGLGDHWRFKDFKVGWKKKNHKEFAYLEDNFLSSAFFDLDLLDKSKNFKLFKESCKNFGYNDITLSTIREESDIVFSLEEIKEAGLKILSITDLYLWPKSPQYYICFILEK